MASSSRSFTFNANDLQFLLNQIRFRPLFDVNGVAIIAWDGIGAIYDQTGTQLWDGMAALTATVNGVQTTGNAAAIAIAAFGTSYDALTDIAGLRQVTGNGNNLTSGQFTWGAVDQAFARSASADFKNYSKQKFGTAKRGDAAVANLTTISAPAFVGTPSLTETVAKVGAVGALKFDKSTGSTAQATVTTTTTTDTSFADGQHWNASLTETTTTVTTATDILDVFGDPITATNKFALPGSDPAHSTTTTTTSDALLSGGELDTTAITGTFRGVSGNLHPGLAKEITKVMGSGTDPSALTDYTVTQNADGSANLHDIVDYTPRMITQTITGNGSKVVYDSKGHYVSGDGVVLLHDANNHLVYYTPGLDLSSYVYNAAKTIDTSHLVVGAPIVDTTVPLLAGQADGTGSASVGTGDGNIYSGAGYGQLSIQGQHDKQNLDNKEYFYGNIASIAGNAPNNGFFALFGQFFDHGLDFIAKSSGYNIVIPLAVDDPLYGQIGPDGKPQTSITITRATVRGFDANGNPQYTDHSSPYIDQSQTYGSVADVTQLLRAWVIDPVTGKYIPGATLFDGNHTQTYTNGFGEATKATLPTLNELRAEILQTRYVATDASGMDVLDSRGIDEGLTWEDVSAGLRHRDASGLVVTGADGKPVLTTEPLLLDMNPKFDVGHLSSTAAKSAMAVLGLTFDANGQISLTQLAKWVNFADFSIQPTLYGAPVGTPLGPNDAVTALTDAQHRAIGEILLDSVGDHYIAGDGRANENFGLTAIHQVWHEEHSYQVRNIEQTIAKLDLGQVALGDLSHKTLHDWQVAIPGAGGAPMMDALGNYVDSTGAISWNQDTLFNAAKLTVEMEYQHVAVDQYSRAVSPDIQEFAGYSSGKDAAISLEFSQAAFRFGHSTLRETIDTMDPNGLITGKITSYALESAFLNPQGFANVGAGAIVQGETRQLMNEVDEFITPSLNQGLLGQPLDLGAINIARGRDLGLPTLNAFRVSAGFSAYANWNDFGQHIVHASSLVNFIAAYAFDGDTAHAQAIIDASNGLVTADTVTFGLDQAKGTAFLFSADPAVGGNDSFNQIDLWIGGIAEKHVAGGILGETFNAIFVDTIENLMDGDRFYYLQRLINQDFGNEIQNEQFVDIVERNTGTTHLNGNIFTYADQYLDFTQTPTDTSAGGITSALQNHEYGTLLNDTTHLGIFSDGGSTTSQNGTVLHETFSINTNDAAFSGATSRFAAGHYASQSTTVSGNYILDVRPDLGTKNLDGSADTGAGSAEVIVATPYDDFIKAGEGDDTVYAGDGNDIVYGGGGADKLYGGNGNDYLYGGDAPDILDGGAGDDHIFGDSSGSSVNGVDQLIGGSGNDFIYGGIGIDKMFGGTGDDVMYGGTDTDPFMYGGDGNDYLNGDSGQDILFGGNGSDIIDGGTGIDQLYGDGGDDILRPGDGVSDISGNGGGGDVLIGGDNVTDTGFDLADYSQQTAASGLVGDLTSQVVSQAVLDKLLANQNPSVFATSTIWFQLEGVIGTPSSDRLSGDSPGDASAAVSNGDNWLIGGSGNDELMGRGGNDVLIGKSIRLDTLIGTYKNADGTPGSYTVAEDANGASHRVTGTLSGGLLDAASGNGITYDKHFQELLKSQAYKDYVLGDGGTNGGLDQADYVGNFADYVFKPILYQSANEGVVIALQITDKVAGRDGSDLVVGIDRFQFADRTITLTQLLSVTAHLLNDTGLSATDRITKDPTLTGSGSPNATVSAVVDGVSVGTVATADANGAWTFKPTLQDGTHTIVVSETSLFGTSTSASTTFVLDTTPPAAPVVTGATYVATNTGLTSYTGIGTAEANSLISVSVADAVAGAIPVALNSSAVAANGNWSFTVTPTPTPVTNYRKIVTLTDTDLAGNVSAPLATGVAAGTGAADTIKAPLPGGANLLLGLGGNDTLTGGIGNDILDGGTGSDTMAGGLGDDIYVVDTAPARGVTGDIVIELPGQGTDLVLTTLAAYTLTANVENLTYTGAGAFAGTGNTLANVITGGAGNDTLSDGGGAGIDTLIGGAGNDTYNVSVAGDIITEAAGGGTDTVNTTLKTYTLGANLENLTFTGTGTFAGTGNGLANVIRGGAGTDTLDGGVNAAGAAGDTLVGGGGDDTYLIRNLNDVITETAGGGTDRAIVYVNAYTLGTNVENMTFAGTGAFAGTGNASANVITGGAGNDTLNGGAGNDRLIGGAGADTLTGGTGADVFVLAKGDANGDLITDFSRAQGDLIQLSGYAAGATLVKVTGPNADPTSYAVRVGGSTVDTFKLTGAITLVNNGTGTDYRFV